MIFKCKLHLFFCMHCTVDMARNQVPFPSHTFIECMLDDWWVESEAQFISIIY